MKERAFWLRLGWRNLGRHRRRSVITALALAWGFAAVVVLGGMMDAVRTDFISGATDMMGGQIRIQHPEYEPEREVWNVVGGDEGVSLPALLDRVAADPGVVGVAPRVYGAGIVASDATSRGGLLMGVVPEREAEVTYFFEGITDGRVPRADASEVLLGQELARQLRTGPGEIVVLVVPAADGSLGNELFTISGILRTGNPELDASQVVMQSVDLQRLLALEPDQVHEIVAATGNPWDAPAAAARLRSALADLGPAVAPSAWTEFRPELVDFSNLISGSNWIILFIIFVMAAFGVANTMLMGTFERRREFAVVKALGMRPGQIVLSVIGEALVLGVLAVAAGVLIALPFLFWLTRYPIDIGEYVYMDTLLRWVLRVEPSWDVSVRAAIGLIVTAVAAALYPAFRAVRVPAAEALAGR